MAMALKYTVAMVFAKEIEMTAFRYMLDEVHNDRLNYGNDESHYILGRVHEHNVVLAFLAGQQGKGAAAAAAINIVRTFPSIRWHILVGVGGGVTTKHDIRLGDVVVSMPSENYAGVAQYDQGRDIDGGFEFKGFLAAPPKHLRATAVVMESNHAGPDSPPRVTEYVSQLRAQTSRLSERYKRPDNTTDVLFQDGVEHPRGAEYCDQCDQSKIKQRKPRDSGELVQIHYGLIASGDLVVMSTERRDEIIKRVNGDVLCFEMEAAGIMAQYPCMVIRGISDYADSHKNYSWQAYAAANAAAVAKELLSLARPERVEYEVAYENPQVHEAMQQIATVLEGRDKRALPEPQYRGQINHNGHNSGIITSTGQFDIGTYNAGYSRESDDVGNRR